MSETQKKEQEWITACKVDAVDKSDEYDPFLVGAYSKPIFEYMMTLEVFSLIVLPTTYVPVLIFCFIL